MGRTSAAFVDSETSPTPAKQNLPTWSHNSESGFYNPALTAPTVNFATVGLADAGTRVRAVINNIPNGAAVFVSTRNVVFSGAALSAPSTGSVARLVQNESTTFVPAAASGTLEGIPVVQLPVVNGTATAVWEVLGTVVDLSENYDFPIWVQSGPIPGTATINGSYAPAPPSFAAAGAGAASVSLPVPRFVSTATAVPLFNTNACAVAAPTSTGLTFAGASPQYNLTATVTTPNPALTGTPAGTVTFYDNGAVIAGSLTTLSSAGMANYSANLPIGTHRLTAVFTPANTQLFTASTSPGLSLSVNAHSATNIEITSSSNPSLPGQAVTFIASVTGSAPTGTLQFTDGLQSLGGATLVGSRASVTVTFTTVGVHEIFATYSGDGGNTDASARFAQTVSRVTDSLPSPPAPPPPSSDSP